jgi:hypothetical protein
MSEARFGMLKITSVIPGLGVAVHDIWRDESGLMADLTMSRIADVGAYLVGHYLRLPEFWMGVGGMVGVPQDTALMANAAFAHSLKAGSKDNVDALLTHEQESLAANVMRFILSGKAPCDPVRTAAKASPKPKYQTHSARKKRKRQSR